MQIDWHRIFFSDQPYTFFLEILFRTPLMFLAVVFVLRLTGKRGVQQLSIFEMVMIITLGSAAGDSMFYEDVGILHAVAVFVIILAVYRLVVWLIAKSERAEKLLEGEPLYIIKGGKLCINDINGTEMGSDEFFGALREQSIEHLGQVRYAILEDNGKISIFYYADEDVKPGLPILPDQYKLKSAVIKEPAAYACARCGNVQHHQPSTLIICKLCENKEWVKAISLKRIT